MELVAFRSELARRGLPVSAVGRHRNDPAVFVVFLAGPVERWQERSAVGVIAEIPGVVNASESVRTPAVVVVLTELASESARRDDPSEVDGQTQADLPARARWGASWDEMQ